jgi:hypothetical protein
VLDPEGDRSLRVPAGWLSTAYGELKVRSPDGEWSPLVDPGKVPLHAGDGDGARLGDTKIVNVVGRADGVPRQDLWIFQFETGSDEGPPPG